MKIPNKSELQQIASNQLFDMELKDFIKLYKDYTKKTFSLSYHNLACAKKTIRLNTIRFFNMKIPNKSELQQIASNQLFDMELKDFIKLYKDYTKKTFSFLVNDTTLPSDNPLELRKKLIIN